MKNKIGVTFLFLGLLFSAVIVKGFWVQVVNREKLIAYSDSQVNREVKSYPSRGHILDRNGSPLAINVQSYDLFTYPKSPGSIKSKLNKLAKIIPGLNYTKLLKNTVKRTGKFTWIGRKVFLTSNQLEKIKSLSSITVRKQKSRMYPNNELSAQVLGFVGIDNDGLSGIEYYFNEQLKGKAVIERYSKDAKGRKIKFKEISIPGKANDINLSIDKDIQASLEKHLKDGVIEHEGVRGGAAVMDAKTGEIWAMANYPSFDPNNIKSSNSKSRKLSFVSDQFEPGSIFKTLTIASALENNIVKPDTNYFCERGRYRVGNHYIKESDTNHVYEWLSVEDILKHSSNIGTTKIAFDLTYPTLKKTLDDFNIGKRTGIESPSEAKGMLDVKGNITPLRLSNISFGQGVATNGIQMLAAYSAIANGGNYIKPTLIKVDDKRKIKTKRILSATTTTQLKNMLVKAVEDGTGSNAIVPHFTIAGKTSTAQRVDEKGGYSGYISGFIGFPLGVKKDFVVYVYVENPKKSYYGNTVAAPIFQKIVRSILYKRKEYNQLANIKKKNNSKVKASDSLNIRQASRRIIRKGIVPNLIGLDKTTAFELLEKGKVKYSYRGFGVVDKQTPVAGTVMTKSTIIRLKFQAPDYE
jgi:cell division protein FtsI (penicillin-binding protein 3)